MTSPGSPSLAATLRDELESSSPLQQLMFAAAAGSVIGFGMRVARARTWRRGFAAGYSAGRAALERREPAGDGVTVAAGAGREG